MRRPLEDLVCGGDAANRTYGEVGGRHDRQHWVHANAVRKQAAVGDEEVFEAAYAELLVDDAGGWVGATTSSPLWVRAAKPDEVALAAHGGIHAV